MPHQQSLPWWNREGLAHIHFSGRSWLIWLCLSCKYILTSNSTWSASGETKLLVCTWGCWARLKSKCNDIQTLTAQCGAQWPSLLPEFIADIHTFSYNTITCTYAEEKQWVDDTCWQLARQLKALCLVEPPMEPKYPISVHCHGFDTRYSMRDGSLSSSIGRQQKGLLSWPRWIKEETGPVSDSVETTIRVF